MAIFLGFNRIFRYAFFALVMCFTLAPANADYLFSLTTTDLPANATFQFKISAAGGFYVDCDGGTLSGTGVSGPDANNVYTITKNDTNEYTYTCTYSTGGQKTIRFGGAATGYSADDETAAIRFNINGYPDTNAQKIYSISGSLGQIFGTIANPPNGFSGQPKFHRTFEGASHMTGATTSIADPNNPGMNYALPPTLFDGVYGAPIIRMFAYTFRGCSGLAGTLPSGLFGNLYGNPAIYMFFATFSGCSSLIGSIPAGLFGNLSGSPAIYMFSATFFGCNGLTGSIPAGLFAGISGDPAVGMFNETFDGCSSLTGFGDNTYVPGNFLAGINTNTSVLYQVSDMFDGTQLDNPCPAGTYDVTPAQFNDAGKPWCTPCPPGTTSTAGATDVSQCVHNYPFTLTTTNLSANDTFQFTISAAGEFYVDCGTDGTLSGNGVSGDTITKNDTTEYTYTCTYSTGGQKTIRFGGVATGYTSDSGAAISFSYNPMVSSLTGDLSEIFPVLGSNDNQIPSFYSTFDYCVNLTSIPGNLFSGITTGKIGMFEYTFQHTGITSIPHGLFANITTGATRMFQGTFMECPNLTTIPSGLFANITTGALEMFDSTFLGCINLTQIPSGLFANITTGAESMFPATFALTGITQIPSNLFAGITSGENSMFVMTFMNCPNLTQIPSNLFSNIISGAPRMFTLTFAGTGITSIPPNLFSNITTFNISEEEKIEIAESFGISPDDVTGGEGMFVGTFGSCPRLASIPDNLFSHFTTGAPGMFGSTFSGALNEFDVSSEEGHNEFEQYFGQISSDFENEISMTFGIYGSYLPLVYYAETSHLVEEFGSSADNYVQSLQQLLLQTPVQLSIPANLFANITTPAPAMFAGTFFHRDNLIGYVPPTLFNGLINNGSPYATDMMTYIFKDTTLATSCEPYNKEQYITGYEDYWDSKVSCKTTSTTFICDTNKYLHIGEDKMCLSETKPNSSPVMAIGKNNRKYYLRMTEKIGDGLRLNQNSNKMFNILYHNKIYNVHDASVGE